MGSRRGTSIGAGRRFLFLQGPHGPFFHGLARMLRKAGAEVWRAGFNAGDRAFWFDPKSFIPYEGKPEDWPERFRDLVEERQITDIVLYGDTRPVHAEAIAHARQAGVTVHVFEEGYIRPFWITYERGGANGHSRLMEMSVDEMRSLLAKSDTDQEEAPAHWGDMRHHIFYGALYHWFVMFTNWSFRNFRPHRKLPASKEARLYIRRLMLMPVHRLHRFLATWRIRNSGHPYHVVLLQLGHDSSFLVHSPFNSVTEFLAEVIEGFAAGAPGHHHLAFKAHPLEDGRVNLWREVRRIAAECGVADRVHYVPGGKLASLLDYARSAVTVNSTAAQQVLWRGLPIKVFGQAVYAKPEFVSSQPTAAFFAQPTRPDTSAYRDYRKFLLETSQVAGGFYSARSRKQLLRQVVDMILCDHDPYDAFQSGTAAARQQLRLVK